VLACLDVSYSDTGATAACVLFRDWPDGAPAHELTRAFPPADAYEPGSFYRRELPCLLAILGELAEVPEVVVIDAYVWLDASGKPGLGAHLYRALEDRVPMIGVAKSEFHGAPAIPLMRGASRAPLFITSAGMPPEEAAQHIAAMSGGFRIPTLLKRVDQLCRLP